MREVVRVALLARPGAGADRLRDALRAAGADLVLEADPTSLEPATLAAAGAESVVVLLDPAVEEALDRLDPVLHDPRIDVLYEEAAVAAAREGWDVARWTRHLSAKLLRHGDVLPPGREAEVAEPTVEPAAEWMAPPVAPSPAAAAPSMFDPVAAEYEFDGGDSGDIELPALSLDDLEMPVEAPAPEPVPAFEPEPVSLPERDIAFEPEPEPVAAAEPPPAPEPDWGGLTLSLEGDPVPPVPPPSAPPAAVAPPVPSSPAAPAGRGDAIRDFRRDLADIEQRIASMGLVDDGFARPAEADAEPQAEPAAGGAFEAALDVPSEPEPAPAALPEQRPGGAVLVFAGIGGPDAVRQFLGALPEAFPRPVLIQQRLDGGRHDRLVQQMARATALPVQLAAADEPAAAGHVYILPPELGLAAGDAGLRFVSGGDPMASLPPADSAVLMFSGSDTGLVDAAMAHAQAGALVAGQSPEDCYDAAAPDLLVARGAETGHPADLARRLAERWAA